jgi:DNA-binding CsgD family transcriptional regulator
MCLSFEPRRTFAEQPEPNHPTYALESGSCGLLTDIRHLPGGCVFDSGPVDESRIHLVLALVFLLVVAGGVLDLILDEPSTILSLHVGFEVVLVILSLGAAAYLARGWYGAQARAAGFARESARLEQEKREWEDRSAELLRGLGAAISTQFDAWSLTPTERKVALMLLKGLSHKRVARLTDTSERTIRQHAVAVYRKAGLEGRAALAGFFLQPLLLPEDGGESTAA